MAVEVEGLDVELLRSEIQRTYAAVSGEPDRDFMFPTGRAWAQDLGYPAELLARVPDDVVRVVRRCRKPLRARAAGVGEDVLDVGCGAGMDTLIAAQMVGPTGSVTGIDMTPEMAAKARRSVAEIGPRHRHDRRGQRRAAAVRRRQLRCHHLKRRHRPDPRQGRRLLRDRARAATRWSHPAGRRHHPAPGLRRRKAQHRPVGRLNRRGSAGSRVRESPAARTDSPISRPAT